LYKKAAAKQCFKSFAAVERIDKPQKSSSFSPLFFQEKRAQSRVRNPRRTPQSAKSLFVQKAQERVNF